MTTDTTLTIREMCEAFSVTPRTLRFYEAKELLAPIRRGTRRFYTRRDRARMTLILRGRRFGFSLEDIRQLLDLYDMGDQQQTQLRRTHDYGTRRLGEMELQYRELGEAIAELRDQLAWGEKIIASFDRKDAAE